MTPPEYAFDPGAERRVFDGSESADLVEAHLERGEDGRLCFTTLDERLHMTTTWLRADFLEPFLAHARAREEDAA